ncbi:MAG: hypothetical protein AAFX56_18460, partial [Pseudomonadota bacterium]
EGASGELYLDADGRVHRRLAWAEFQNGVPVALPPAAERAGDERDLDRMEDNADAGGVREWNRRGREEERVQDRARERAEL